MRIRLLLCLVTTFALLGVYGDPVVPKSSNPQLEAKINRLNEHIVELVGRVDALNNSWKGRVCRSELNALRKDMGIALTEINGIRHELRGSELVYEEKTRVLQEKNEAANRQIEELEGDGWYWKWIVFGVGGAVLAAIIFVCVLSRRKPVIVARCDEDLPKCPRCGWKYARGETKCRNCGTRF